jgi:general secretion pathway protein E
MNGTDRRSFERSLAARLIAGGKLDDAAFDRVARLQDRNNVRLEALLVKLGLVQERDVAEALAEELGLSIAGLDEFPEAPVLDSKVSEKYLRHNAAKRSLRVLP